MQLCPLTNEGGEGKKEAGEERSSRLQNKQTHRFSLPGHSGKGVSFHLLPRGRETFPLFLLSLYWEQIDERWRPRASSIGGATREWACQSFQRLWGNPGIARSLWERWAPFLHCGGQKYRLLWQEEPLWSVVSFVKWNYKLHKLICAVFRNINFKNPI